MSNEPAIAQPASDPAMPEYGVVQRADGVYLDPSLARPALVAAVDSILNNNNYFTGLDYTVLIRALYGCGPKSTPGPDGWQRFASGIVPFEPQRRELYHAARIDNGAVEYYFEPVYLPDPTNPGSAGVPAQLTVDEFVADLWSKGIRFGIDVDVVRAAIKSGASGRLVVARRLEPVQGQDARVVEVSDDLHRSDAPRQLANGMVDLHSFQNRFPQIHKGVRLLKKVPRVAGSVGFELGGAVIEPAVPQDLDLQSWCGPGTLVERTPEGEFLVAQQDGFLSVDSKTNQISIGSKIVSHEGVSAKTTGNLQLSGDYEEFGEVQEKREIEGDSITVHADVFGKIVSRGGTITLNRNLSGGTAINKDGDILVRGMAANAVIQTSNGQVVLERAENSIISGTSVRVEHAINCEILAHDVAVGKAEGCLIGGRRIVIDSAAPRRQAEMVVSLQVADARKVNVVVNATRERLGQLAALAQRYKADIDRMAAQPDVRKYMRLATGVRKNEITLTPEQAPVFQRMAQAVGPTLKEIGKLSEAMKAIEAEVQFGQQLVEKLEYQRDQAGASEVELKMVQGDVQVRAAHYHPDGTSTYDLPVRDIKARLRETENSQVLFAASSGSFSWHSEADASS
ncbi:MAG: flagellar assembly protein A [Telluria sp.]